MTTLTAGKPVGKKASSERPTIRFPATLICGQDGHFYARVERVETAKGREELKWVKMVGPFSSWKERQDALEKMTSLDLTQTRGDMMAELGSVAKVKVWLERKVADIRDKTSNP